MLEEIKRAFEDYLPGWVVTYDERHAMNCAADAVRAEHVLYIEEYHSGTYPRNVYGNVARRTLSLYFFTSHSGDILTAEARDVLRETLERDGIQRLLSALADEVVDARYSVQAPLFDIHEVGVWLTLTVNQDIC